MLKINALPLFAALFFCLHLTAHAENPVVQIQNKSGEAITVKVMNIQDRVNNFEPRHELHPIATETLTIEPGNTASSKNLNLTPSTKILLQLEAKDKDIELTCTFFGDNTKLLTWDPSKPKTQPWLYPETGTAASLHMKSRSGHSLWHNVKPTDFTCFRLDEAKMP